MTSVSFRFSIQHSQRILVRKQQHPQQPAHPSPHLHRPETTSQADSLQEAQRHRVWYRQKPDWATVWGGVLLRVSSSQTTVSEVWMLQTGTCQRLEMPQINHVLSVYQPKLSNFSSVTRQLAGGSVFNQPVTVAAEGKACSSLLSKTDEGRKICTVDGKKHREGWRKTEQALWPFVLSAS